MLAPLLLSSVLMMPTQTADAPVAPAAEAPVVVEGLTANADFTEGRRLYDSFEFEKASFRFRAATRAELTDADRALALIWLGVAQGQAGDAIAARESFSAALALDSAAVLPQDAPPTLEPVFIEARAATQAPAAAPVDAAPAAPEPAPAARSIGTLTIVGGAVVGAGALLAAGGAGLGILATNQANAAAEERFQDDAIAGYEAAQGTALLANGLFIVGGAAIAAGVVVLVVAPFLAE